MKTVLKNFFYNTGYQLLIILTPIITTPYLARVIGANGIGEYSYANSIAYYFVMFIMLGLNNYGNRTIASIRNNPKELSRNFSEIYCMQLILGIFVTIIYVFYCFLEKDILTWLMVIYVFSAVLDVNWFFWGLEKFRFTVFRNIVIKIITILCIFAFVKKSSDLYVYVLILVLGSLISNLVLWPAVFQEIQLTSIRIREVANHLKPNLVLFIPIIAVSLYKYMDKIMLGVLSNMKQVGYYEYSEKVIQIPIALVNSLGTVMLPKMSNLAANNKNKDEKKYIFISLLLAMFFSSSLCFGLMGIAKEFVPIFYGQGYQTCISLFYVLLPSCCFIAFANVFRTQYLIPHRMDIIYIKSVIYGAIINFLLNSILISRFQAMGAAVATLCAEAVVCIYQTIKIYKIFDMQKYIKDVIPFILSAIGMFLCLYNFPKVTSSLIGNMFLKICIGVIVYFILLLGIYRVKIGNLTRLKGGVKKIKKELNLKV